MKINAYFENHKSIIERELFKSKSYVKIAVAWINFEHYFNIFNTLLKNKIKLSIICSDNFQNRSHLIKINELVKNGANIKLLKMPHGSNHMHHKFIIIDDITVINGSFNWTPNAQKSVENIVVINGVSKITTDFLSEFEKLINITTDSIVDLQKLANCKQENCSGNLFNILIFSANSNKYSETSGDIVQVCNHCETFKLMKSCISNTLIDSIFKLYNDCTNEYEEEIFDRITNNFLSSFISKNETLHAIGKIIKRLEYPDNEITETIIVWKNKFVGDKINNSFQTDFNIIYD